VALSPKTARTLNKKKRKEKKQTKRVVQQCRELDRMFACSLMGNKDTETQPTWDQTMKAFIGRLTWLAAVGFLHWVASEYGVAELGSTICDPNITLPGEPSTPVWGNILHRRRLCLE